MRHPNIIYYMGLSFDDDRHYYMITEFAEKGSIFDLLHSQSNRRHPLILSDQKIFKIVREMALAIEYLHQKKIFHCDLKS